MKKISILLVIMLVFSSISAFSAVKFYDGEASVTENGSSTFTIETVDGFGGKTVSDKVYKLNGKGTNYGANYIDPGLKTFQINGSVEYSLLFEDEASIHTIAVNYYDESKANGGGANNILKFSPSYDHVKSNAGSSNIGEFKFETGKWYRIAIDYTHPSGDSSKGTFEVYINGVKIGECEYNTKYGVRRLAFGCSEKSDGTNSVIYIDNITSYNQNDGAFNPSENIASEIVSADSTITENNGTYVITTTYTAQDFKNAIVTSGSDDVVRLYNQSLTKELSADEAIGDAVLVIAAKCGRDYETAYSYYKVTNDYIESDTDLYKGTEELNTSGITVASADGNFGKSASDKVYKLPLVGGSDSANFINLPSGGRLPRLVELSFAIPEGGSGIRISSASYTASSGSEYKSVGSITIAPGENGLKYNVFSQSSDIAEGVNFDYGKWYAMAIEFPANAEEEFKIYINGELVVSDDLNYESYGMRHIRLGSLSGNDADSASAYLDNIRSSTAVSYSTKKDMLPKLAGDDINCVFENEGVRAKKGISAGELTESIVKDEYTVLRVCDADMNLLENDDIVTDDSILVAASTNKRSVERAYSYYTINTVTRIAPALRSDVYELGETISIMPYTTLEAFLENVIVEDSCTLVASCGETVYQPSDILADGSTITVTDIATGEELQTHRILLNAKSVSDNFDKQSEKMYTGGVTADGSYSFAGPVLNDGYLPEEYAYIEALDYPGKGKVIHSYSNGSHSAESGRVHMNLISKVTPKKAAIGSCFAFHVSVMLPKSNDTYAVLASYKTKNGETKTLQVALQMKDGSVSFFGGTVGSYKTGEWTDILLLCDSTDGSVTSYINNVLVAETKITSFKEFDSFTNIRPVHHIYQSGKVVESYLSCFEVFGIGSVCTKVAADNNTMLLSDGYTVSGQEINGFISMTASDIIEASHIADGATIKIYTASGSISPSDAKVESGMYAVVISASGVAEAVYTFGAEHCRVDGLRILVNGGANFEKFVSGSITAQVDAENYCNTAYPLTIAIAHYSGNKLLALDFNSFELSKGSHKPEVGIEISDTADTFIKAFVFGSDKCLSPLEANLYMEAFSADSIEDVRILYPGYVEKAVTFSYDDLVSNDERLIGIFDENGIKGTFNLMTNRITESNTSIVLNRYSGHEIASHSWSHPRMYITKDTVIDGVTYKPLSYDEVVADIQKAQDDIEALTGEVPVGFAWPYARASSRKDYSEILDYMQSVGIRYTRSVTDSFSFDLPTDWMEWDPTCHHDDAAEYTEKFINLENDGTLKLLYIWGHSYEFSTSKVMDWDGITEVCRALGADNSIWKATNGELYNYIEATKLVEVDYDNGTITNNSSHDVYLAVNSVNISVPANSQFVIKP